MITKSKLIHSLNRFFIFAAMILLASGCVQKVKLQVLNPAEIDTRGITKVAVGKFEVGKISQVFQLERNGKWVKEMIPINDLERQAVSNQIRARVISLLSQTPYFDLVYTDEFATLENDASLQQAIASGGFKTSQADAVINGKFWLEIIKTDGVEPAKSELEFKQGGSKGSHNYEVDILAYWPYKSIKGTLGLEMKMTRLSPTEVIAVTFDSRSYAHKIGGQPRALSQQLSDTALNFTSALLEETSRDKAGNQIEESDLVLPNFDQIVSDLSESIAATFVRRVAITQQAKEYQIAGGGNKTAQLLIEAGAYEKAIQILNNALNNPDKEPDDFYNLGLCFEATGDFGLAAVSYEDALKIDPTNLLYAQGAGRIDLLKQENLKLKAQLSVKPQ